MLLTISLRSAERLLVVIAGAISIYLGYKLFLAMPKRDASSGKIDLPGGISIFVSRVGPGVFFSLFGSIVIALSLHFGVQFSDQRVAEATGSTEARGDQTRGTVAAERKYSAVGERVGGAVSDVRVTERTNAVLAVESLNRVAGALSRELSSHDRVTIDSAILAAKLSLMRSVWDEANWGAWSVFKVWVNEGEADPPPAAIETAVRLFRAGTPTAAGAAR